MSIQPQLISNAVPSVAHPTTLLILVDDHSIGSGWCEQFSQEGYNVLHVKYPVVEEDGYDLRQALLKADKEVSKLGCDWALITYGLSGVDARTLRSSILFSWNDLKACIHFCPNATSAKPFLLKKADGEHIPSVFHIPASQELLHAALIPHTQTEQLSNSRSHPVISVFTYPLVPEKIPFPLMLNAPSRAARETVCPHIRSATTLSLTRTLTLLRRCIGPYFDLESVWDQHAHYEFVERDAQKTLSTMVSEPYVNHISTLTGGMGRKDLLRFYKYHFTGLDITPPDTEMITVSRTVGTDRIIDEMIFKCTHTTEIDYFLPGIPPTGKKLEFPVVGIVAFRGDKMFFEYWDQASVLVQLDLLDPTNLPVAGVDVARKVLDPFGVPSNTLLARWKSSEGLSTDS
ncbi:hypothetical protein EYR40_003918 [Pleurotus pulmonarius]|nr:hypothetical protein EYR40_003918 [Pleurotus pulmonarius]KAF4606625.1 hypothetical protein EYR38_000679 [Pleurotus pulmonarius]